MLNNCQKTLAGIGDNDLPDIINQLLPVFQCVGFNIYRLANNQFDSARFNFERPLGHDFAAADDADRNNRRTGLYRQVKGPRLESFNFAVAAAGALRKRHDGFSLPDTQRCQIKALQGLFVILPVDFYFFICYDS